MSDFLIYTGITIDIIGSLLLAYGAISVWNYRRSHPDTPGIRESTSLKLRKYILAWIGAGIIGTSLLLIAAYS